MKEERTCQNCKSPFIVEDEDFQFYKKIQVPPPTWCPECRFQRRLMFRNERTYYKDTCKFCGKNIISFFSPSDSYVIYCFECWWSDKWNGFDYGVQYDFSKNFFQQFEQLVKKIPMINRWGFDNVNCEYAGHCAYSKNVYLSTSVVRGENIFFSYSIDKAKDIFDSFISNESELCYENVNCHKISNSTFLVDCRNCLSSNFLYDCVNCQDCFMSSNLRNKKFFIRNKEYDKDDYWKIMKEINLGSYSLKQSLVEEFREIYWKAVHKYADVVSSTDCTGNNIRNSKKVYNSFLVGNSENLKNCWRIPTGMKDSYDISGALDSELVYEGSIAADHNYMNKFYIQCRSTKNLQYSMYCGSCADIFGCAGLKNKQYCILNKQYTKEEYESLVPKIIQHMNEMPYIDQRGREYRYGEFFPLELSPFAYNEVAAQEYFPLTKERAIEMGYTWRDPDTKDYAPTVLSKDLPDHIRDVPDSITKEIIQCAHASDLNASACTTAFRIIPEELQFYRRMNLPLPRLCPNCRHYERLSQRNPLRLWHRTCMKEGCVNEFETSYAPDRPEIVYCESCYQKEII